MADNVLLTIPLPCSLTHLLGTHSLPLSTGTLSLVSPEGVKPIVTAEPGKDDPEKPTKDDQVVVVLKVGELAFPISKSTPFGTTTASQFSYLFRPTVTAGLPSGFILLSLPSSTSQAFPDSNAEAIASSSGKDEDAPPELIKLRDAFEEVLVSLGLLTDSSLIAGASEIGHGAAASLRAASASLATSSSRRLSATSPVSPGAGATFSPTTHDVVGKAAEGAEKVREFVGGVAGTLDGWARAAGDKVGQAYGNVSSALSGSSAAETSASAPSTETKEPSTIAQAGSTLVEPLASASSNLGSTAASSAHHEILHSQGSEAAELASKAGDGAAAVGGTVKDGVLGTSTVWHGSQAVAGAVKGQDEEGASGKA